MAKNEMILCVYVYMYNHMYVICLPGKYTLSTNDAILKYSERYYKII